MVYNLRKTHALPSTVLCCIFAFSFEWNRVGDVSAIGRWLSSNHSNPAWSLYSTCYMRTGSFKELGLDKWYEWEAMQSLKILPKFEEFLRNRCSILFVPDAKGPVFRVLGFSPYFDVFDTINGMVNRRQILFNASWLDLSCLHYKVQGCTCVLWHGSVTIEPKIQAYEAFRVSKLLWGPQKIAAVNRIKPLMSTMSHLVLWWAMLHRSESWSGSWSSRQSTTVRCSYWNKAHRIYLMKSELWR
jgi:hypothetical protein